MPSLNICLKHSDIAGLVHKMACTVSKRNCATTTGQKRFGVIIFLHFIVFLDKRTSKPACAYFHYLLIQSKTLLASEVTDFSSRGKQKMASGEPVFEASGGSNQVKSYTRGKGVVGRRIITLANIWF